MGRIFCPCLVDLTEVLRLKAVILFWKQTDLTSRASCIQLRPLSTDQCWRQTWCKLGESKNSIYDLLHVRHLLFCQEHFQIRQWHRLAATMKPEEKTRLKREVWTIIGMLRAKEAPIRPVSDWRPYSGATNLLSRLSTSDYVDLCSAAFVFMLAGSSNKKSTILKLWRTILLKKKSGCRDCVTSVKISIQRLKKLFSSLPLVSDEMCSNVGCWLSWTPRRCLQKDLKVTLSRCGLHRMVCEDEDNERGYVDRQEQLALHLITYGSYRC